MANNSELQLRPAGISDAERLHAVLHMDHIKSYISPRTLTEISDSFDDPDDEYVLAETPTNPLVGFAYLRGLIGPHRSIELRQLAVVEAGKGDGGAFMPMLLADIFGRHKPNRLWLDVFPDNDRARRLYTKLGFIEEGTLRDAYLWNGKYRSTVVMSILAAEYAAMKPGDP